MAKPDHDDGSEVNRSTDDDQKRPGADTGTTGTSRPTAARPVRTAPVTWRRRHTTKAGKSSVDEPTSGAEGEVATPDSESESSDDQAASSGAAPDPSDLEKTLGYRERRRARAAAARRTSGRVRYAGRDRAASRWLVAGAFGVVIIIIGVASSIALAIGIGRADHRNDLRAEYSTFARQMIVNLTTLNPHNVDAAMKTMQDKVSGRALQQMQQSMKQAVGLVRDQNVDTKSSIISDAVTKQDDDSGTVILVSGWQMKSPDPKQNTVVQTFRWRVQLTRINGVLKMTNFEWVT